jgi:hypothetical protein
MLRTAIIAQKLQNGFGVGYLACVAQDVYGDPITDSTPAYNIHRSSLTELVGYLKDLNVKIIGTGTIEMTTLWVTPVIHFN